MGGVFCGFAAYMRWCDLRGCVGLPLGSFCSRCFLGISRVLSFPPSGIVSLCRSLPYGGVDGLGFRV